MQELVLYGQKTSKSAVKLIIQLFNKINNGSPYTMKTITTIYKNDEIFKDNMRYPIDAPYRAFYKELTEEYVSKYGLDNIFFEKGIARIGNYYFEFAYNDNHFTVVSSPSEIELETRRRYIPMLYSMVTGVKIDWENAKVNFSQNENEITDVEGKHKILLVFGKDSLKTLEFSWLATFELKSLTENEIETVINEIRNQEAEIINFTQGVLFSELDEVIINFERVKELVKNHKHTIKNFGFEDHLMMLHSKLESANIEAALEIFEYIENLVFLRDISTNILYNFDGKATDLLLFKNGFTTYTKILSLFVDASINPLDNRIIFSNELANDVLNQIETDDLIYAFTILINLYSNISSKDNYSVKILKTQSELEIVFENEGIIEDKYIEYLLGKTHENPSKGEGLRFIVSSLERLPHINIKCNRTDNRTVITLAISSKK
jgi:hypothetical protein